MKALRGPAQQAIFSSVTMLPCTREISEGQRYRGKLAEIRRDGGVTETGLEAQAQMLWILHDFVPVVDCLARADFVVSRIFQLTESHSESLMLKAPRLLDLDVSSKSLPVVEYSLDLEQAPCVTIQSQAHQKLVSCVRPCQLF